jgi:hypothetical protein
VELENVLGCFLSHSTIPKQIPRLRELVARSIQGRKFCQNLGRDFSKALISTGRTIGVQKPPVT